MTPTHRCARIAALACLIAATGCAGDPHAAAPAPLSVAGQIGGAANAVVAQDGTAWVGIGPRVVAFDVRGPGAPVRLDASAVLTGTVRALALGDGRLYAALGHGGMAVLDGRTPGLRVVAALGPDEVGDATGLDLPMDTSPPRLLVAGRHAGLTIVDVADPTRPRVAGRWEVTGGDVDGGDDGDGGRDASGDDGGDDGEDDGEGGRVDDVAAVAGIAFAAVDEHGVVALDVGDPTHIRELGRYGGIEEPRRVLVVGASLWVSSDKGAVEVLDIRNATALVRAARVAQWDRAAGDPAGLARGVVGNATRVLVAGRDLLLYDVGDPPTPRLLGAVAWSRDDACDDCPPGVALDGDRVVVASSRIGAVSVFDVADVGQPRHLGTAPGVEFPFWPVLVGAPRHPWLYTDRVRFDVSDPTAPRAAGRGFIVGGGEDWGGIYGDAVADARYAYVTGDVPGGGALAVYDLDAADGPRRVDVAPDVAPTPGWPMPIGRQELFAGTRVVQHGTTLVLAGAVPGWGSPLLAVADVADPTRPRITRFIGAPDSGLALSGNYSAIAWSADGRHIVGADDGHNTHESGGAGGLDVIDLTADRIVGRYDADPYNVGPLDADPYDEATFDDDAFVDWGRQLLDVVWVGHHAFAAAGNGGLRVYDVRPGELVREVADLDLDLDLDGDGDGAAARYLADASDLHLVVATDRRLVAVDIADPLNPRVVASAPLPSAPRAMTVFRGHAWVATEDAGLVGYDLSALSPDAADFLSVVRP